MCMIVFAKAPVAGEVKTRLIPRLGATGAARLHEDLVRRTLQTVKKAKLGDIVLCCAPDCSYSFFKQCADEFDAVLQPQSSGNLGERMHTALASALGAADRAILVGTDCPVFDAANLRAAADALQPGVDLVFVPAEDGGYVLIGARRIDTRVFEDITWGSAAVMRQTRDRLLGLGWRWNEQPALWDVDRPADLDRLLKLNTQISAPA